MSRFIPRARSWRRIAPGALLLRFVLVSAALAPSFALGARPAAAQPPDASAPTTASTPATAAAAAPAALVPSGPATILTRATAATSAGAAVTEPATELDAEALFAQARANARLAAEGLARSHRYLDGWLRHGDPATGLIPRNLRDGRDLWNAQDAAADNYSFMVLAAALTDRALFEGRLREMLRVETRRTSRLDRLPDTFRFSTGTFATAEPNLDAILFGASEYVKDGLLPLTEWLGPSPWSERMIGILDDIWKHAPIDTPFGRIPSTNIEVNGEQLQALARGYWMTGRREYLDWAMRLGDYYLLGNNHPTRDLPRLRLRDHGCEIVGGLSELYVAVDRAVPEKKAAYRGPLRELYDTILATGRNEHGLLYDWIEPRSGKHAESLCDTWGYDLNALYTVHLVDGWEPYRLAAREALGALAAHYRNHAWEGSSADGYADAIESALNLYNREPIDSAADWIDSEIRVMWSKQQPDGVIEGWHGDGNFTRTTIMYVLWKTRGTWIEPWRADVRLGAAAEGDALYLIARADDPWRGAIRFDRPRHRVNLHLPIDYPRINQFPEWFTVEEHGRYVVEDHADGTKRIVGGAELQRGLAVELAAGAERRWRVAPAREAE